MRVITGTARGRRLKELEGMETRPTTDRVKEGMFSALQFDIEGRKVLDLFAGTGQLGIECLSRGAESCVFVDESREAVRIVKENLKTCNLKATVLQMDAVSFLRSAGPFDLIFIDPPYDSALYETVLEIINLVDILSDGGIIVVEARKDRQLPEMTAPYRKRKEYSYGKVKICIYTKESQL